MFLKIEFEEFLRKAMVRVDELCWAELMNNYKSEAQNNWVKIGLTSNNTAKTITNAYFKSKVRRNPPTNYSFFFCYLPVFDGF
jgi:hypothetical protein